jgi:predicted ATPase/DNA-binding SARP family transcriptional activator
VFAVAASSPAESEPSLRVYLLGGFAVSVAGRRLPDDAWSLRRAAALVKLLALAPGHRLPRDQIVDALWPDADPAAAANSLHRALYVARRALEPTAARGSAYLRLAGDVLSLQAPGGLWVDVDAFTVAASAARRDRDPAAYWTAVERYTGDLLPDDAYEDWAADRRETLRQEHVALLLALANVCREQGEPEQAIAALRRLVAHEPAHEAAHRGLMRLYAEAGQGDRALQQFQHLREALARDLDAAPDAESQRLYDQILAHREHRRGEAGRPGSRGERTAAPVPPRPRATPTPPVAGPTPPASNLPAALSSFIGRECELAEVRRLLGETRLLTLTGAGGVGKTRLALEAARAATGDYPDGVWLVELAALADPTLVPQAMARVLGVAERPGEPVVEAIVGRLTGKRALLVLDNCEHLVEACAALVDEVLRRCIEVRVLATSRERLRIAGESAWRVPSLALPGAAALTPVALAGSDAVQLFVARAAAAQPGWALTDGNAAAVAEICARLDGVPLALELAAARLRALSVAQVAARLDDAFRLLTGGSRAALPRQQTLRATIDWSYDLLDEPERVVLRRLSVFAGGWTLEAAEAVCAGDGIEGWAVLDLVAQLVDKSLVVADAADDRVRHRLLETIRQYARDRLVETPEMAAVRDRHRAWCLALAEAAEPALWGNEHLVWLTRLEAEHDNLRAALAWSQEAAPSEGLRLAASLYHFWRVRGHQSESRRWLNDLLALAPTPTAARGKALVMAGMAARGWSDLTASRLLLEESLAICRASGDRAGAAYALNELAFTVNLLGDAAQAQAYLEDGLALALAVNDARRVRSIQNMLGTVLAARGDYGRARTLLAETAALDRQAGDAWSAALSLVRLGQVAWQQGEVAGATAALRESLGLLQDLGDRNHLPEVMLSLGLVSQVAGDEASARSWLEESLTVARAAAKPPYVSWSLWGLGQLAGARGEYGQADAAFREGLAHARERPDFLIMHVEGLAMVAAGGGRPTRAARLLGAAAAARQARGIPRPPVEQAGYEALVRRVEAALDGPAFAAAWATGAALTLEQAVAEALMEHALDGAESADDDPTAESGGGLATARPEE